MRSFTAKSNRGKGEQVFWNNVFAVAQRSRNNRKKQEARQERALQREAERKRRLAQKEAERQKRELEKKKTGRKQQKKIQQYYNRLALDFKKINVILIDSVAIEIIQGALDANLTQAKMISYFVKGEEQKLKKKVTGIILQTKLDEYLEFIDDNEIKNTITYKSIFTSNKTGI